MRRTRKFKRPEPKKEEKYRINHRITAMEVRLIDETDTMQGIVSLSTALKLGEEKGLDVIEVNPKAEPPVCKLGDYGQFQYELKKQERKQKSQQKQGEIKGLRLTFRISEGDLKTRRDQGLKFLEKGNKLKIDLMLRGRERMHADLAIKQLNNFVEEISKATEVNMEQPVTRQGNTITVTLAPKKS